jgi:hypothetical protein
MNSVQNAARRDNGFEAMRRATDVPLLSREVVENPMRPRLAAEILFRGMRLREMPNVTAAALQKETVVWRFSHGPWITVHWFTVTAYSGGLLRLRNDVLASVPKTVWRFRLPPRRSFELTFHWSEIRSEIGEPLFAFCSALDIPDLIFGWPLFSDESTYPGYAWTKKAREFQSQFQKRT